MIQNDKAQLTLKALNLAYDEACTKRDFKLCDKLRAEIQKVLSGKPMLIKIESGLNISGNLKEYV